MQSFSLPKEDRPPLDLFQTERSMHMDSLGIERRQTGFLHKKAWDWHEQNKHPF